MGINLKQLDARLQNVDPIDVWIALEADGKGIMIFDTEPSNSDVLNATEGWEYPIAVFHCNYQIGDHELVAVLED